MCNHGMNVHLPYFQIGKSQRDPALILVAAVIEVSDFEWCLAEGSSSQLTDLTESTSDAQGATGNSRFFMVIQ